MERARASERRGRTVLVPADGLQLQGILAVPGAASGAVIFAHGSGSGRLSPRNNFVARVLQQGNLATLLLDLLTEEEAEDRNLVFDIDLLARRLRAATDFISRQPDTHDLRVGYFGASTGAAAALEAAAQEGVRIGAVVSRGGRPDLAGPFLGQVKAATLLIVGGADEPVIQLNQEAFALLTSPKDLVVIPGATHLFEEPGTLEQAAELARDWFNRHLAITREAGL